MLLRTLALLTTLAFSGLTQAEDLPPPRVSLKTNKGEIVVEMNRKAAPLTVKNFLQYVRDGHYDGTIFHRVIAGFMIQGGGHDTAFNEKETRDPILNESMNRLSNLRGSIAMAREEDPDTATAQFYINVVDNTRLDYKDSKPGYTVFGKVIKGMEVVDAIAASKTHRAGPFESDVPVEDIVVEKARIVINKPGATATAKTN
ncbi:MAG: peptidylprolyl isomerase [Gammaproteobacteria bacterium]|nr:peptidylprolyl isomerase [Gammaproteobacteria bacterium]